jgi:pseudaminic acid synthase
LYKEAHTPWDWHEQLFATAREEGLICFSSPFDPTAVDFLEALDVPAYKIASFEITDIPLIRYVAEKGKPVIISTGIAGKDDILLALQACRDAGNDQIILLKCTSSYPAPVDQANLAMIQDFAEEFDVVPGLSDHTLGITVPVVATTLGAKVIEKHFILDKSVGGPDASFSLDEKEFKQMVDAVRDAEKAMGKVDYQLTEKQKNSREFSRSLYVVKDMKKGDIITRENVRSIRPGFGLHPKYYEEVLGKKVGKDLSAGTSLQASSVLDFEI